MTYCHTFDLEHRARLALNYLTRMTDPAEDWLPYWMIQIHVVPPFARHCRVDDAELVASWYEGITAIRKSFGFEAGAEQQAAFKRHLLKSWGEHGLRFHEKYPWTDSVHSSFHEMAYVLGALNRSIEQDDTEGEEVRKRARELVEGMRKIVIERRTVTFWGGDAPQREANWQYEFPNDVFFQDRGWDLTCHTGRGEQGIRNGMMLHSLVRHYELTGLEVSLDLAQGLARHLMGTSRYFNYRREFFGHVHSAVWVASGLALLGQVTGETKWVDDARMIFEYVLGMSSSFGWVPEYGQWHPPDEENCESCCIKDMIQCAIQLTKSGYDEYWDVVNRFARNQLIENQVTDGAFLADVVDSTREDADGSTWKELDKRIVGGFSGGAEPNSISLARFRALAGCCAGTVPQAFSMVWENAVVRDGDAVIVNMPLSKETEDCAVAAGYPQNGLIEVRMKKAADLLLRRADWMGPISLRKNGEDIPLLNSGTALKVPKLRPGDTVLLSHPIREIVKEETVRGVSYRVHWRGPDVVKLEPEGLPLRLYVRQEADRKRLEREMAAMRRRQGHTARPTEQK